MFPIIFRQEEIWEGSMGLQSYPVPHEVGSHVCKEYLGIELWKLWIQIFPLCCFTVRGSQENLGAPAPACSSNKTVALSPIALLLLASHLISQVPGGPSAILALPLSALPHGILVVIHRRIALNLLSLEASIKYMIKIKKAWWNKHLKIYSYIGGGEGDRGCISKPGSILSWGLGKELGLWRGSNLLVLGQTQLSIPKEEVYKKAIGLQRDDILMH